MRRKSPLLLRASKFYISKVGTAEDSHLNLLLKQSRMVENLMVLASLLYVFSIRLLLVFNILVKNFLKKLDQSFVVG